jgi:hypothetical protein
MPGRRCRREGHRIRRPGHRMRVRSALRALPSLRRGGGLLRSQVACSRSSASPRRQCTRDEVREPLYLHDRHGGAGGRMRGPDHPLRHAGANDVAFGSIASWPALTGRRPTSAIAPKAHASSGHRHLSRRANSGSDTCSRIVSASQNVTLCDVSEMALLSHIPYNWRSSNHLF